MGEVVAQGGVVEVAVANGVGFLKVVFVVDSYNQEG